MWDNTSSSLNRNPMIRLFPSGPFFVLIAFLWCGCSAGNGDGSSEAVDSALYIPRTDLATVNELRTATGKTWRVHQVPMLDSSLVSVVVDAVGFSNDSISIDFGEIDPVVGITTEDLDKDGYQELYIVTQSTGPEAYGTLYGVYSEMDTSVTVITYEGPNPYLSKEGEPFAGYQGQDQFVFDKGKLTNTFMALKAGSDSESASRTIAYGLVKTPGAVRLTPVREK